MPILPVLDLMQGKVVRGIAGKRENYRPIVSSLVGSADPLAVARALRDHFGFDELYLADLDAIQQGHVSRSCIQQLVHDGFRLWVDAGIRTSTDTSIDKLLQDGVHSIVAGLESLRAPLDLREIVDRVGAQRVVFSLDMKAGQPLGAHGKWLDPLETLDPGHIADIALKYAGVRRILVLDLLAVGAYHGSATASLCTQLRLSYPDIELTTGGGVRDMADVKRLLSLGVDNVLVASALHDGRILPEQLRSEPPA